MILYDDLEIHKAEYARVMSAAMNPSLEWEFVTTLLTTGSIGKAQVAVSRAMQAIRKATGQFPASSPALDKLMSMAE